MGRYQAKNPQHIPLKYLFFRNPDDSFDVEKLCSKKKKGKKSTNPPLPNTPIQLPPDPGVPNFQEERENIFATFTLPQDDSSQKDNSEPHFSNDSALWKELDATNAEDALFPFDENYFFFF